MLPYHITVPSCFSRKVQDWETKITNQPIGSFSMLIQLMGHISYIQAVTRH
jgi:hypothetical protein